MSTAKWQPFCLGLNVLKNAAEVAPTLGLPDGNDAKLESL